ncbi:MAG: regulatory iron-sulfur-containing complex subunit RicT [bacterium]
MEILEKEIDAKNLVNLDVDLHSYNAYKDKLINSLCEECKKDCTHIDDEIDFIINEKLKDRNIIEAECQGLLGNHFCDCPSDFGNSLIEGDLVLIECEDAIEVTKIIEIGNIAKLKMFKQGMVENVLPKVVRKLNEEDHFQIGQNKIDENHAKPIFRNRVEKYNLNMKLVDIHFQFDRKKLFFFYTSDGRVDFRELAKDLAAEFKTRIELRQIGVRDEAKRIGGLGTCGREYCCSIFLYNFKKITTQLANEQNLSSNMSKLSGPCGKLKCCLSFEGE